MSSLKFLIDLSLDESGPPKSPWGINIMKKTKKAGPKAFGVRLEDCQPGINNKVGLDCPPSYLNARVSPECSICDSILSPTISVHPADRGDLLWSGGGHGSGIHGDLQSPREQRHGVAASGSAQQGRRHQPCRGGEEIYDRKIPN